MNSSKKFSFLVWACNLMLIGLALVIIGSAFYFTLVPKMTGLDQTFEGATKYSTTFSQNFLSDHFYFERVFDKKKGIDIEGYYFSSELNLYSIPISDSIKIEVDKIQPDLSFKTDSLIGSKFKNITVTKSGGSLPVCIAAPAIPLSREEYKGLAQKNILFFILTAIYTFIFFWFLRKFISGLRKPGFFSKTNAKYLYISSGMVTIAPFFWWGWTSWIRPDLYKEYVFDGVKALNSTSSIPTLLFVFGLILLVIAWCFDQGVKLQKEQELTV